MKAMLLFLATTVVLFACGHPANHLSSVYSEPGSENTVSSDAASSTPLLTREIILGDRMQVCSVFDESRTVKTFQRGTLANENKKAIPSSQFVQESIVAVGKALEKTPHNQVYARREIQSVGRLVNHYASWQNDKDLLLGAIGPTEQTRMNLGNSGFLIQLLDMLCPDFK